MSMRKPLRMQSLETNALFFGIEYRKEERVGSRREILEWERQGLDGGKFASRRRGVEKRRQKLVETQPRVGGATRQEKANGQTTWNFSSRSGSRQHTTPIPAPHPRRLQLMNLHGLAVAARVGHCAVQKCQVM